ncbi:MAG: hypothetical protein NVSMB27_07370 [Ktedonobacteraceae bacterium]
MDLPPNASLPSPVQNDGDHEHSTVKQVLQGSAIPCITILEQMPVAFVALDTQWRITSLNSQAEALLHQPRAELLGRSIWEALPKAGDTPFFHSCQQARTTGKAVSFEYLSPLINKWFHVHVSPAEGGICVYFQNITARKQAEERLRQSEKHFRAPVENNADGIALTDENGIITYASPSTTHMVGYPPEEIVGGRIFGRKDYPDGGEATRRLMARVLEEPRKSQVLEIRTGHKNGTFLWMEVVGINLLDEPGVDAIVWYFRDVTQRKQLEQEVTRANEQLEAILHNVADGIVVIDSRGRIVYVNEIAASTFGFPSSAALLAVPRPSLGQLFSRVRAWDERGRPLPFEERPIVQALHGKKVQALFQYQDALTTSQRHWILVRAQPIVDAQGQVPFAVSVYTDITEQKELEQRKDHFISMASHELKTPLTILSAFTQLLLERFAAEERPDVVRQLSKMDDQITNLIKLVADLLDISKMQAGQLELAQEAVDMDELAHEVFENLQPTTTHHLLIEGAAQRPISGDRDRLGQVLIILLTNAIKYSPHADTVFVRVEHTHDALTVSVQDFGIGIAQSHQQKLFERFYRVLSKKDQTYPGLGIGLYIAHEIIERHGGKMWVESIEGKGSTFFFSLPMREARESTSLT